LVLSRIRLASEDSLASRFSFIMCRRSGGFTAQVAQFAGNGQRRFSTTKITKDTKKKGREERTLSSCELNRCVC